MKRAIVGTLVALLAGAGLALAQAPEPCGMLPCDQPTCLPADVPACPSPCWKSCDKNARIWGGAEALGWVVKPNPIAAPLLSTGLVGDDATQILLGSETVDTDVQYGSRFTLGAYLDSCERWAVEGSYFFLTESNTNKTVASDGSAGSQPYGFPFLNPLTTPPSADIATLAFPGFISNRTILTIDTSLQGGELNGFCTLTTRPHFRLSLLAGARYLDLDEDLSLASFSQPVGLRGGTTLFLLDQFSTRNQFYGGQVGLRANWSCRCFFLQGTAKLAIGDMQETVDVDGFLSATSRNQTFLKRGGFFSQLTNIGRHTDDQLAFVPEVNVLAGTNLGKHASVFVGYNFLWISNVLRPGDQIDPVVNPFLVETGTLIGPARPVVRFHDAEFWAQGISAGFQLRF